MQHQRYFDDYYNDTLYPGLASYPQPPAANPSPNPRSPLHLPPPQPASAPSFLPHTSTTSSYSAAPGRRGPEPNLSKPGQASRGSKQGSNMRSREKAKGGTCGTCGKAFTLEKDLTRHIKTIHRPKNDKPFLCCCCWGEKGFRLDNYKRHVKKCKNADETPLFICGKNHVYVSKEDYLEHLKDGCR